MLTNKLLYIGENELGVLLINLGLVIVLIGVIGTWIAAFKTNIWWGLGCLFFWPVSLIFLILNWDVAVSPFFLQMVGLAIMFVGVGLA